MACHNNVQLFEKANDEILQDDKSYMYPETYEGKKLNANV